VNTQKGSFALIVCFVLGFFALMGGVYYFASSSHSENQASDSRAIFDQSKARMEQVFSRNDTWNVSVERNPNAFACLKSSSGNCQGRGGLFVIYDGNEPLSQLNFSSGLDARGVGCQGFPSEECAVRVEASWEPVCSANGPCDNTRSAKIQARVVYDTGKSPPEEWKRDQVVSPQIQFSEAVICERGGGVWALTECLSPDQASQRQIASGAQNGETPVYPEDSAPMAVLPDASCPNQQMIQGELMDVEPIGPNRAQVRIPAMNGCPADDIFIFQCQPISARDREGQWVQIEAQLAPACDANGNPVGSAIQQ
jgi:hypothetical protein